MRRLLAPLLAAACALPLSACGLARPAAPGRASAHAAHAAHAAPADRAASAPAIPAAHPQAVEPVAGASGAVSAPPTAQVPSEVSVGSSGAPSRPLSDAAVRQELEASGLTPSTTQSELTPDLLAVAPIGAPSAVQEVIDAGNQIAHLPYIWGGGHQTYEDTGYDCSGSLSFVLAAAGLLNQTMTSGQLMSWGDPGPGKWITIFAAPGHTFMYVAGLRFDTVALAETGSRWSNRSADEPDLKSFVERHPPGL